MFSLRFFGSFTEQRKALLTADAFTPIPLHPTVQAQLDGLTASDRAIPVTFANPVALFVHILRGVRGLIVDITIWNAVAALVVLGSVAVTRQLVNDTASLVTASLLAVAYLVLRLIQAGIDYGNNVRRLQIHRGVQVSLYRIINDKLLHIDPASRQAFNKGQLKTLVGSDVESIEDFISAALHQWTTTLVTTAILAPALVFVSGWIGAIALVASLSLIPVATIGARIVERYQKKVQESQDSLTTLVGEWVKNIRLVRFLGWPAAIENEVVERMRKTLKLGAIRHTVVIVVFATSFSWSMVPLLAIFLVSSLRETPLGLVEVFSTFWILDHLLSHIQHIPHSLSLFGSAVAGAQRVIDLTDAPNLEGYLIPVTEVPISNPGRAVKVHFENVSVQYGETTAVDSISLSFDLTKRTAIVGSVGSGKTSIAELLVGERHPSSGQIEVEFERGAGSLWREDIYSYFRQLIAYSPQQPFLSNAPMRLNIDLSGTSAQEDLETAAIASQLKPDILLLPRLYEEEIGESGINLSGGQRQRVSLARAFLSRRKLLVLDDPLSAVDPNTESLLMNSIVEHAEGLILVSHRLDELNRCDRVLVLDRGRIVEDGVPTQLAANSQSRYSAFLRAMEDHVR